MTPKVAEEKLIARRKRVATRRGPQSSGFTIIEQDAVCVLAAHAHSQASIATRAGMSLSSFKRCLDADSKLRDALDAGVAEERLRIDAALLKTALDSTNPRQIQAAMAILKSRHGLVDGRSQGASTTVNVSVGLLPAPQDPRTFSAMMRRIDKDRAPITIEHETVDPGPPEIIDPVRAVKEKQRAERS